MTTLCRARWDRMLLQRVVKAIAIILVAGPLAKPADAEPLIMIEGRVDCAKWLEGRAARAGANIVQAYLLGSLNGIAFWGADRLLESERRRQPRAGVHLDGQLLPDEPALDGDGRRRGAV